MVFNSCNECIEINNKVTYLQKSLRSMQSNKTYLLKKSLEVIIRLYNMLQYGYYYFFHFWSLKINVLIPLQQDFCSSETINKDIAPLFEKVGKRKAKATEDTCSNKKCMIYSNYLILFSGDKSQCKCDGSHSFFNTARRHRWWWSCPRSNKSNLE